MALLLATVLLALGLSLAVVWHAAFLQVLQGLAPLLLLFVGVIFLVVGYSERKARREYDAAMHDDEAAAPPRRAR
jgi:fatty acid desaturase